MNRGKERLVGKEGRKRTGEGKREGREGREMWENMEYGNMGSDCREGGEKVL